MKSLDLDIAKLEVDFEDLPPTWISKPRNTCYGGVVRAHPMGFTHSLVLMSNVVVKLCVSLLAPRHL